MMLRGENGDLGYPALKRVVLGAEQGLELAWAITVQGDLLKAARVMRVHVQVGLIGPTEVAVLLNVMEESNLEPGIVSMAQKMIVQGMLLTSSNAIFNRVPILGL